MTPIVTAWPAVGVLVALVTKRDFGVPALTLKVTLADGIVVGVGRTLPGDSVAVIVPVPFRPGVMVVTFEPLLGDIPHPLQLPVFILPDPDHSVLSRCR